MLQKCGNKAHPSTGVWIMYMEMIWWVWESVWLKCHMAYITLSSPSLCVEYQGQSPLLISERLTAHERNEKIIHSCTNHLWLFRMSTILSTSSFVQQTPGSHTSSVSLAQINWTLSKLKTPRWTKNHLLDTHVEPGVLINIDLLVGSIGMYILFGMNRWCIYTYTNWELTILLVWFLGDLLWFTGHLVETKGVQQVTEDSAKSSYVSKSVVRYDAQGRLHLLKWTWDTAFICPLFLPGWGRGLNKAARPLIFC